MWSSGLRRLLETVEGRFASTIPDETIAIVMSNAGHRVILLVHSSVFLRQNVHLADATISTCREHGLTSRLFASKLARHQSGHAIRVEHKVIDEFIETIFALILHDTIGLDD